MSGTRPLDGIRILAVEQMQALPFATQLLARLGADVVKIEAPGGGDIGRGATPAITDPQGRRVGATFLRNNLNKRSMCVDLKTERGRDIVMQLAPRFDVFCENFKSGGAARLGIGWDDIVAVHPSVVYLSISGFGNVGDSPYRDWPAFAPIVEAMSGIYERARREDEPPRPAPVGALGDISAALFGVIGVLAALRQRDLTGKAQRVDIAMLDAVVAMTDIVVNFWSLGLRGRAQASVILDGFKASDGWFIVQVGREPQFKALMELVGKPELVDDDRLTTREGWVANLEDLIRPAIESWAAERTRHQACVDLAAVGIAAGPCLTDAEVVADPHLKTRGMLVEMEHANGEPVMIPGNPVKIVGTAAPDDTRVPWLGEHSDVILEQELGLGAEERRQLRDAGVIS